MLRSIINYIVPCKVRFFPRNHARRFFSFSFWRGGIIADDGWDTLEQPRTLCIGIGSRQFEIKWNYFPPDAWDEI